ncbi:mechanosensitive ion channel protein 6-like [Coffea arabica]|uniref:Mechanosensitive ion channel protein n=1 Tax=Coffea arabica TaxID=13443 RepID=A0ABM4VY22_COFAR
MAQPPDPTQIIVPVEDDIASEDRSQPRRSSEKEEKSRVSLGSASPDAELTGREHVQLLPTSKKGDLESKKNEEAMESSFSRVTVPRKAKLFAKSLKSRLDAPRCGNSQEDEDWFLDEDVLAGTRPKKMSLLTLFQLVSLVLVMIILVCTLSLTKLKKIKLWDLPLWKWEMLISVIISGHLVTGWGVRIIVFTTEQAFVSKNMRVLYFVYGMKKAVQHCIWLTLILIVWHYLVAENMGLETRSKALTRVSKALLCLVVGSLVWLVKVFFVKVLASSFYNKTFFERAKVYLFKQYVIKKLSAPPGGGEQSEEDAAKVGGETKLKDLPQFLRRGFSKSKGQVSSRGRQRKLVRRKAPGLLLKRWLSMVHSGLLHGLSTLDEGLPDSSDDEDEKSLSCKAEKVAKKIFKNVAKNSEVIVLEDLKQFMKADKASLAMHLFEGTAGTEGINEHSFTRWMVDAYKERIYLQLSLSDTKTAVDELHHLMDAVVIIIIVIIWLLIFELAVAHFIVIISSQLLLVGFIFQNTLKTVFEAIIFLFIMHPYDVGDRCEIEEVQMVVVEMNILTTEFERYDGQKIIYPNSILATRPIGNYNRSPHMGDQIEFSIHISTPWDKILTLQQNIRSYVESNAKHWYPDPTILIKDVEDMNRLVMVVWPKHRMNHQDMRQRWLRRALLVDEMIKIFRELDIQYRPLPLDMNVRNMPAVTSNKFPSNWTTCSGSERP